MDPQPVLWTAEDLELAARLASELVPHHPVLSDEMELYFRWQRSKGPVRGWTIGEHGFVAVGREGEEPHAWFEVYLPGGGATDLDDLYAFAEQQATALGATEGVVEIWEDCAADLDVLRSRGWAARRRERYWRLELQPERDRLAAELASARERVAAEGLAVVSAAALGGEAIYPILHEVNQKAERDVPRSTGFVPESFETWREWMSEPRVLAERVWVGVADGRPVGLSYLAYRSNGMVETGFTGVLREFRGRGLARAMKLETLLQAAELGVDAVETDNDSENGPIIHLNEALGYEEITGVLELAKEL